MDGGDDSFEQMRFFIPEDVSDDELDGALETFGGSPVSRAEETEPIADMLGDLTGDADWAASFSAQLSQLDFGGQGVLEVEEKRQLLRSLARFAGEDGFTFEQVAGLWIWADRVRIQQGLLEAVLAGELVGGWDEELEDLVIQLPGVDDLSGED